MLKVPLGFSLWLFLDCIPITLFYRFVLNKYFDPKYGKLLLSLSALRTTQTDPIDLDSLSSRKEDIESSSSSSSEECSDDTGNDGREESGKDEREQREQEALQERKRTMSDDSIVYLFADVERV